MLEQRVGLLIGDLSVKKSVSAKSLDNHLRKMKKRIPELAWLDEVSSHTRQQALANLDLAYNNFFQRLKAGKTGDEAGFPKFKSRYKSLGTATFYSYRFEPKYVNLSNVGRVKLAESDYAPVGKYGTNGSMIFRGVRVSEKAGRWFVSVQVEMDIEDKDASNLPVIGVDVGIKSLAVVSDGRVFENPRATKIAARKLRRLERSKSRRTFKGKNRDKTVKQIRKLHARIANIRKDATHKATTDIAESASVIGVETLNIAGMVKNRKLAKAVSDANMSEFQRQVKYKADWSGARVVSADGWEPSSKTCSNCGNVKEVLRLSEREYVCQCCGMRMDRDLNAARNLAEFAGSYSEN